MEYHHHLEVLHMIDGVDHLVITLQLRKLEMLSK